ncbi:hypothetical protein JHK82_048303 [Glycine max]|uniref:Uncharacterized protein n=2 Tax=Glycine subgen. Soja TaxID=1462606 RepID=A0A0R0FNW4_SOYBN|nr:hypothetical protein JHK86_048172 [Glycine max]KAG4933967.1 hypothetical protein JHK87_047969 [Glycine soja]KAG4944156.1 hypothetical protein JHK85_048802 [Glycine max]KAG5098449.1 hypothetical protein JHK82_048303 [Glycine max]KAG5103239.1 hypothetical protein JHK84_048208 [Glycine max]
MSFKVMNGIFHIYYLIRTGGSWLYCLKTFITRIYSHYLCLYVACTNPSK